MCLLLRTSDVFNTFVIQMQKFISKLNELGLPYDKSTPRKPAQ